MRRRARAVAQCALFELPVVVIAHQRSSPPIRSTARCPIMRSSCRRCSRTASTSCTSTPRSPLASRSSLCSPSPPKASLRYAPHVRGTCPRYALPTQLARNSRTLHARRTSQFRVAANARRCSRSRALDRFSPLRAAVTRAGARPFLVGPLHLRVQVRWRARADPHARGRQDQRKLHTAAPASLPSTEQRPIER